MHILYYKHAVEFQIRSGTNIYKETEIADQGKILVALKRSHDELRVRLERLRLNIMAVFRNERKLCYSCGQSLGSCVACISRLVN